VAAKKSQDGKRAGARRSGFAAGVAVVVAVLAGAGWTTRVFGLSAPLGVAASCVMLAPIAFRWSAQVQGGVALAGIGAFVMSMPPDAVLPERLPSILLGLVAAWLLSVIAGSLLDAQRDADRLERRRSVERIQQAVAGLEIRAGVANLTTHADGSPDVGAEDIVGSIERIAVGLGRAMVEQRKEVLHEREMNAHFIGQAAHEFRTPLTVIQTAAEALKLYSGRMSSHAQHVRLVKIEESVQQMTDLLRNALLFSRADAGKIKCERQPVDLRALAQEVSRDIQTNMGEHEIVVTVRGAARLPQLDPSLAREILINLLTNAAKYSPGAAKIEVEVFTGSTEVRIKVTDHGIGIAPEDQKHVFEAFRRGDNVGDIPGTGLGLAITKRAVENHGGTITLESKVGSGTTFTVTLPERAGTDALRRAG
jgi:signal transduction histidine kinase